jgi:HD-like signal output (HDOD) protein
MGWFNTLRNAVGPHRAAATACPAERDTRSGILSAPQAAAPTARRLLLVSEDAAWLRTLEPDLRQVHPDWECHAVSSPLHAVEHLQLQTYAAIVLNPRAAADVALATAIANQLHPLVRVVLCDADAREEAARWTTAGACVLPVTVRGADLADHIIRADRVREWMADAGLKKLLGQCRKLPAVPKLYSQVTLELTSPRGSLELAAQNIAQDPMMTAKVLQVVNSAFFALGHPVHDPVEAVIFLGAERTRSLVLLAGVFSQFENSKCPGFSVEQLWNHSLQVATLARIIAIEEKHDPPLSEAAFTAGLIHDLGKLILAANLPAMHSTIEQLRQNKSHLPPRDIELQVLGTTHAELAACLLGTWGLPLPVLEAVSWHHCPSKSGNVDFTPLTAVHVANVFAYEMSLGPAAGAKIEELDHNYLLGLGLGERRNVWRDAVGLPPLEAEEAEYKKARLRREAKVN